MTDEQLIKALECCTIGTFACGKECPYYSSKSNLKVSSCRFELMCEISDLIDRQKAEIERLNIECQSMRNAANSLKMHYEEAQAEIENYKHLDVILHTAIDKLTANIKSEAVKEFAERLKETITNAINTYYNSNGGGYYLAEDTIEDIDNLAKEMTEHSADVEEVRHGKWINDGDCFHCSVCNKTYQLGSLQTIYDVRRCWKYCPNCGAKMDKE